MNKEGHDKYKAKWKEIKEMSDDELINYFLSKNISVYKDEYYNACKEELKIRSINLENVNIRKSDIDNNKMSDNHYCGKCGSNLEKDSLYCPKCGEKYLNKDKTVIQKGEIPTGKGLLFILIAVTAIFCGTNIYNYIHSGNHILYKDNYIYQKNGEKSIKDKNDEEDSAKYNSIDNSNIPINQKAKLEKEIYLQGKTMIAIKYMAIVLTEHYQKGEYSREKYEQESRSIDNSYKEAVEILRPLLRQYIDNYGAGKLHEYLINNDLALLERL